MTGYINDLFIKRDTINKKIEHYQNVICKHINLKKTLKGNTGNFDLENLYWTDCECLDCGKRWMEDHISL